MAKARPEPSDNAKPPHRKWYRLHLSTWVVILLTSLFLLIIEGPGETIEQIVVGTGSGDFFLHGWPWCYLYRFEYIRTGVYSWIERPPWLIPHAWNHFAEGDIREFSLCYLVLDLFVCLTIILVIAFLFEWRRRLRTRLFQFTLRELLLLMLLTAGVLSWWRIHHGRRIRELKIVNSCPEGQTWIDEYRGPRILAKVIGRTMLDDFRVFIEFQYMTIDERKHDETFLHLKELDDLERISDEFVTDRNLSQISSPKKIQELYINNSQITDLGMEMISHFPNLKVLTLSETAITNRGVRYLDSTPMLERLELHDTKIDDDAAETLGHLKNLTILDVAGTKLTDESAPYIGLLSRLDDLDIRSTKISDKAVPFLGRLSCLKTIDISKTKITEKGYRELKTKLPACEIFYGGKR
jgi:hypothetical protein